MSYQPRIISETEDSKVTEHGLVIPSLFPRTGAELLVHRGRLCLRCAGWSCPIYDYTLSSGERSRVPLEDARATNRAFAMADKSRYDYTFREDESHSVSLDACLRQIRAAVYRAGGLHPAGAPLRYGPPEPPAPR